MPEKSDFDIEDEPGFFIRTVQRNLEQAGGIASVTVADGLPLDFAARLRRVSRQDQPTAVRAHVTRVGEGYLNTMGIPLLRGRGIAAEDRAGGELVAVISKALGDACVWVCDQFSGSRLLVKSLRKRGPCGVTPTLSRRVY